MYDSQTVTVTKDSKPAQRPLQPQTKSIPARTSAQQPQADATLVINHCD
jgi:hypothetical protein